MELLVEELDGLTKETLTKKSFFLQYYNYKVEGTSLADIYSITCLWKNKLLNILTIVDDYCTTSSTAVLGIKQSMFNNG